MLAGVRPKVFPRKTRPDVTSLLPPLSGSMARLEIARAGRNIAVRPRMQECSVNLVPAMFAEQSDAVRGGISAWTSSTPKNSRIRR